MVKIETPKKECKYFESCNLKMIVTNCNTWKQNTDRCIIFKLMNENQELNNNVQELMKNIHELRDFKQDIYFFI